MFRKFFGSKSDTSPVGRTDTTRSTKPDVKRLVLKNLAGDVVIVRDVFAQNMQVSVTASDEFVLQYISVKEDKTTLVVNGTTYRGAKALVNLLLEQRKLNRHYRQALRLQQQIKVSYYIVVPDNTEVIFDQVDGDINAGDTRLGDVHVRTHSVRSIIRLGDVRNLTTNLGWSTELTVNRVTGDLLQIMIPHNGRVIIEHGIVEHLVIEAGVNSTVNFRGTANSGEINAGPWSLVMVDVLNGDDISLNGKLHSDIVVYGGTAKQLNITGEEKCKVRYNGTALRTFLSGIGYTATLANVLRLLSIAGKDVHCAVLCGDTHKVEVTEGSLVHAGKISEGRIDLSPDVNVSALSFGAVTFTGLRTIVTTATGGTQN